MPEPTSERLVANTRSPAERMHRHRERRRDGLRTFRVDLRETEVDELVRRGLLKPERRHVRRAASHVPARTLVHPIATSTNRRRSYPGRGGRPTSARLMGDMASST